MHPVTRATESMIEALAAVDCDYEALDHIAHANVQIARMAHERAQSLRRSVRPELEDGYRACEEVAAAFKGRAIVA